MSASIHAILFQFFVVLTLMVAPIFLCAGSADFRVALGFMAAYALVFAVLFFWIPVRCNRPGCDGHMRRGMTRVSFFTTRLGYDCDICKDACDHDIFLPDITIEAPI